MVKRKLLMPLFLIKLYYYEFWPYWIFYAPMFIYGLILSIKARSITYFTASNPCMKYGGTFYQKKMDILSRLKSIYIPKSILIPKESPLAEVEKLIIKSGIDYPIIAKPNIGERGIDVEKIDNSKSLKEYLRDRTYDTVIQEFINFELELGVFYYRFPDGSKDGITSVVQKEFLSVTGNGYNTMEELVKQNIRARQRLKYLKTKFIHCWKSVIPSRVKIQLEPIGNHSRGTKFISGNHLINDKLVKVFRDISSPLKGFYYGRFDIKTLSLEDLYNGRNIKILELNGVNSEPAHIYDPHINIIEAYRSIIQHMNLAYHISMQNIRMGASTAPFLPMLKDLINHLYPSLQNKKRDSSSKVVRDKIS